jgi:hypothetical protein
MQTELTRNACPSGLLRGSESAKDLGGENTGGCRSPIAAVRKKCNLKIKAIGHFSLLNSHFSSFKKAACRSLPK